MSAHPAVTTSGTVTPTMNRATASRARAQQMIASVAGSSSKLAIGLRFRKRGHRTRPPHCRVK